MTSNVDSVNKETCEDEDARDGALDGDLVLETENELKLRRDQSYRDGIELQVHSAPQVQQQHFQEVAACWESFLNIRSIKVLLVESDDSTRYIVSALLRNCNYEVIEAANGLQAWKILVDLNNHVDLVLTEVAMPRLSGVGLLCKIMSHKTRKTLPVIMTSCHDSVGLVFKCLFKGAVDFLLKPIRKNELKNLWQHVWRRCHSSSGSGSDSGEQSQKSVRSKSNKISCNIAHSDEADNDESKVLNNVEGSDSGSGAQSSWTQYPPEAEGSKKASPLDQVAEGLDSTSAEDRGRNAETSGIQKCHVGAGRDSQEESQFVKADLQCIQHQVPSRQIQHSHHHNSQKSEAEPPIFIDDKSSSRKSAMIIKYYDSSSIPDLPGVGEPGNSCLNRIVSATNCGSNLQKGNCSMRNAGSMNEESHVESSDNSRREDACMDYKTRKDPNKYADGEADLSEFRQRRRDRFLQKKVRHQSRKPRAEHRSRVHAQFSRPTHHDNSDNGEN